MLEIFQTLFATPRHLILLVVFAWLGMLLAERGARRRAANAEVLGNLIFYILLAWIVGGRLLYAAAHLPAFIQSPSSLVSPNAGLFDPLGAGASAVLAGLIYARRHELPLWDTLDNLTPFFAVLAVGMGLAHLAEGAAFGAPTNLPWAVEQWNAPRHPAQIYETLAALIVLGILQVQRRRRPGLQFLIFAALSAAARLFLEAYRGDSRLITWGLRLPQLAAWLVLLATFLLMEIRLQEPGHPQSGSQLPSAPEHE